MLLEHAFSVIARYLMFIQHYHVNCLQLIGGTKQNGKNFNVEVFGDGMHI